MASTSADIAANLARVRERIAAAAERAGRDPAEVSLVGVTKTHAAEVAAEAFRGGVAHLGENRVQEAMAKIPRVAELLDGETGRPTWHMLGHLQTNKAKVAIQMFDVIETVDSVRLAGELSRRLEQSPEPPEAMSVLLEVYVGEDPARPGFRPDELPGAAGAILEMPGLAVRGLMTVAPLGWDTVGTRGAFARVRELRDRLAGLYPRVHWQHLSMGMSDDFELAVEEGSTIVRIGRALLGARESR